MKFKIGDRVNVVVEGLGHYQRYPATVVGLPIDESFKIYEIHFDGVHFGGAAGGPDTNSMAPENQMEWRSVVEEIATLDGGA